MNSSDIRKKLELLRRTHGAVPRGYIKPSLEMRPVLDEKTVAAFEAEHHVTLPAEYRTFLLESGNGGTTGPSGWIEPLQAWHMDGFSRVEVTVTGQDGISGTAGTSERPGMKRPSDPAKPFLLTGPWTPFGRKAQPSPLPPGANPYDGCLYLAEKGCGYFEFLVVTGPRAGEVWADYTAGDGEIGPTGDTFATWYEGWLDATLVDWVEGAAITEMDRNPMWTPSEDALTVIRLGERLANEQRPGWLAWFGHVRLYERRIDEAERWFARLAAVAPDDVRAPMGLCRVHLLRGEGAAALAVADAAFAREGLRSQERAALLRLRARALRSLGRLREAIRTARDSIEAPAYGIIDGYFELAALQREACDRKAAAKTMAEAQKGSGRTWAGSGELVRGRATVRAAFADFCARRTKANPRPRA